jgi:dTDP-glucose 4,6-dehydratase
MSKSILVTGGAGFIGSNFVPYFCEKYPEYLVINLDKLTYAGSLDNLKECENMKNHVFVRGDICDEKLVRELFKKYDIRGVIHFAAESHVDNSIKGPRVFVETNVLGTMNLLETARNYWMDGPNQVKEGYEDCRFHHISTDEVYGTLGNDGYFTEATPYAPNSPYSASKAGSDFLVRAYNHTYGMNVTTSNCSNNYGPKQHREKLIPTVIEKALNEEPIPIYGKGTNVRDWLYVLDHCKAIDLIFHKGKSGETYNIGCDNEKTNLEIVKKICSILDEIRPRVNGKKHEELITFVKDRAGHDLRYAIDAYKICKDLGWNSEKEFNYNIAYTVNYYFEKYK